MRNYINICVIISVLKLEQCWRGTECTFIADEGRTAEQMKAVSGHQTTSALQVYVNNSKIQKEAAARSVSLNPVSVSAAAPAVSYANAHHGADSSQQPHKRKRHTVARLGYHTYASVYVQYTT